MIETTRAIGVDTRNELPTGWRWVRLGEVCELNPRRPAIVRADDAPTTFVPMAAVGEGGSGVVQAGTRPYKEVKRGYTYVGEEDVLFAKITPCMQNGKHAIAHHLIDGMGFGSTEFHVIRPTEAVLPDWIHRFLMQPVVLSAATTHFTGAVGQQRVPAAFLAHLAIPLPPLPEQRRIAAILRERMAAVERARAAAEAQLAAARALPAAYLRAVFESDEAREWPTTHLGTVASRITKGESPEWQGFEYVLSGPQFVRSENVFWGNFSREPRVFISPEFHAKLSRSQLRTSDVLVNLVGASIGRACVVPPSLGEANVNQAVGVISLGETLDPYFLTSFIISERVQAHFRDVQVEVARPNISLQNLRDLEIPIPPLGVQHRIAGMLNSHMLGADRARQVLKNQLDAINQLPAALLRQAFSGEL